ncbi:MAG: hypothetical protein Q4C95_08340 [Planctomycetia bacterium]|nr:hypothetical protein [Planctomycetia bacterium]
MKWKLPILLFLSFLTVSTQGAEIVKIDSIPQLDWSLRSRVDSQTTVPLFNYKTMVSGGADVWYDSTYWKCDIEWARVGKNWQHPGNNAPSVRCFNVPEEGEVILRGTVAKFHLDPGTDGVKVMIRLNDQEVWTAEIDGGDSQGVDYDLSLKVHKGDQIRFIVHQRGQIACDTTKWDPSVVYANDPNKSFVASEAFDSSSANEFWSYEVESTDIPEVFPFPNDYATNFSAMIQYEWLREDSIDGSAKSYLLAAQKHLDKARTLLNDLRESFEDEEYEQENEILNQLSKELQTINGDLGLTSENPETISNDPNRAEAHLISSELIYAKIRGAKRRIAFSNPVVDFGEMLFCKRVPTSYNHLVMQYFGWRARPGGGIFVLEEPGKSLKCRDLLNGQLEKGNVLEPKLSYDAKKIVFSFVDLKDGKEYDPHQVHFSDADDGFYHIYSMNIDGSDLKQLTSGSFDDITPNWLPDGDIVFSSTRRKGYARCFWWGFGKRWHVYTIYRMKPDGSAIKQLSWHDTNEWFPVVSSNGVIVYARWDYIDRDAVTHQNLWAMRPDGTNPLAVWGNATPTPHCTFQAKPIPNTQKYIFTASAHHSITGGSLVILDPSAGVDGEQSLTRITPEIPFPESESSNLPEYYESPFPLSEKYFLTSYSPYPLKWEGQEPNRADGLGIYLYDIFGNRELIYRDAQIGSSNACPIIEQPVPPILASQLPTQNVPDYGEMAITDIYEGLGKNVKRGSIKEIRVVQIFPKTTRDADNPAIGLAGEENARAILGHVPVEEDGSAFFKVPAETPVLLQAIDENGFAYQTMRSLTYLQRGEKVSCTGCHENRVSSAYSTGSEGISNSRQTERPKASLRESSTIDPGELGGRPFSYVEVVQPIWDKHCIECHNDERTDGQINLTGTPDREFTKSYYALCVDKNQFWGDNGKDPTRAANAWIPRFGGRNTIQVTEPGGQYGSLGCRLIQMIKNGHENVQLSADEMRRLATWVDMNAIFYGVNNWEDQERQRNGEIVAMPEIQ